MSLLTKLMRRYKQRYAPITPNKSFLIWFWIVNDTIQSNFTRISSKPMLISPRHFALTGWISVRGLFLSRSSEYDNQSHNFKNLNFCDVTLVFSFDSALQQSLLVFIHNCIMKSLAKLITVWYMQYILSISILLHVRLQFQSQSS